MPESMLNYVNFLTGNRIINSALLAWFIAQLIKFVIAIILHRHISIEKLISAGGMPSSHSSTVVAMTTTAGLIYGTTSAVFAIAFILSIIVMYDAAGIRRAADQQARVLNYMMDNWDQASPEMFQRELKELLGHTPYEVLAGAILGFFVALALGR